MCQEEHDFNKTLGKSLAETFLKLCGRHEEFMGGESWEVQRQQRSGADLKYFLFTTLLNISALP